MKLNLSNKYYYGYLLNYKLIINKEYLFKFFIF